MILPHITVKRTQLPMILHSWSSTGCNHASVQKSNRLKVHKAKRMFCADDRNTIDTLVKHVTVAEVPVQPPQSSNLSTTQCHSTLSYLPVTFVRDGSSVRDGRTYKALSSPSKMRATTSSTRAHQVHCPRRCATLLLLLFWPSHSLPPLPPKRNVLSCLVAVWKSESRFQLFLAMSPEDVPTTRYSLVSCSSMTANIYRNIDHVVSSRYQRA